LSTETNPLLTAHLLPFMKKSKKLLYSCVASFYPR